ncbi:hypothetical protein [Pseudomonas sp. 8 R 14]|uniref:hypothetical protein n=1 Tax=Pseudomonas sp. 8 R 14 TaxID=1844092 RepID=UPI00114C90F3|nr:hypothetical protein [Pseudomonas sp. 8 R 14]
MFVFLKLVMSFSSLRINSIEWDGDFLNVSGDGWSFSSSIAWRVSKDEDMLFACWDEQASVRIKELVGLSVGSVSWIAQNQPVDPSFTLSDGRRIDVFCSSVCEPWVMTLPNNIVYVGNS